MIYIKKDNTNAVVLTLSEVSSLINPNYLFEFIYQANLDPVALYFTTTDESLAKDRYNLFNIIENTTGSTTGGTSVALSLMAGQYKYNVYESTASTLTVSATTGIIIETGRMVVDDINQTQVNQIIPTQNNTINNIYN